MTWECESCSREFVAEHSTACPGCGSTDVSFLHEKVDPGASGETEGPIEGHNADELREILMRLCDQTYDLAFGSDEWEESINKAVEEILKVMEGGRHEKTRSTE
jgi:hypothetical protein